MALSYVNLAALAILLPLFIWKRIKSRDEVSAFFGKLPAFRMVVNDLLLAVIFVAFGYFLLGTVSWLVSYYDMNAAFGILSESRFHFSAGAISNPVTGLLLILFGGLLFPLIEEALFRGIILKFVSRKINIAAGIAINSIAYGMMFGWNNGIAAIVLSIFLSVLAIRSGGILSSYLAHAFINTIIFTLAIVAPGFGERTDIAVYSWTNFQGVYSYLLFGLAFTLPVVIYFLRKNRSVLQSKKDFELVA